VINALHASGFAKNVGLAAQVSADAWIEARGADWGYYGFNARLPEVKKTIPLRIPLSDSLFVIIDVM
jgi:hypothetical protein